MTEELKPCPFCGAKAHFEKDSGGWEWVECESCGIQSNQSASLMDDCKPKLREEWNARVVDASLADAHAEIARLRGALERYRREVLLGHQPHMLAHTVDELLDTK
jgi:hypothetical protein